MRNKYKNMLRGIALVVLGASLGTLSCTNDASAPQSETVSTNGETVDRGEQIVTEYLKRDSAPYRKTRVRLTVEPIEGKKEVFVLETLRKQTDGETRSVTRILEPKEDSDVATLTIEKKTEPTVNINYIASRKQFRESGTNKMFFGGLTSQELLGEWDKYESRFLSEKELKGAKVFEVESTLKPKRKSVISRIVTSFGADDYLPRELHLFNSSGKEIRTFTIDETKTFGDKKIASKTRIQNHIYKAVVTLEVLEMSFPEKIPDATFERDHLKR